MKIFHDYTFTWWQLALLKVSLLALGILIGSLWAGLFAGVVKLFLLVFFIIPALYLAIRLLKKSSRV